LSGCVDIKNERDINSEQSKFIITNGISYGNDFSLDKKKVETISINLKLIYC